MKKKIDQETLASYPPRSKNYSEFVGQSNSNFYYLIFRMLSFPFSPEGRWPHFFLEVKSTYLITALAVSAERSKL